MLHRACFTEQAFRDEVLPIDYNFGGVLLVETIRLEPQFRGYGIGLLALDRLVKYVARASPEWALEGMIVLEPSMMSETASARENDVVQEKLIPYYGLFGLEVLVRMTRKHCTFVGQWMGYRRPQIDTVVPHLFQ